MRRRATPCASLLQRKLRLRPRHDAAVHVLHLQLTPLQGHPGGRQTMASEAVTLCGASGPLPVLSQQAGNASPHGGHIGSQCGRHCVFRICQAGQRGLTAASRIWMAVWLRWPDLQPCERQRMRDSEVVLPPALPALPGPPLESHCIERPLTTSTCGVSLASASIATAANSGFGTIPAHAADVNMHRRNYRGASVFSGEYGYWFPTSWAAVEDRHVDGSRHTRLLKLLHGPAGTRIVMAGASNR